MIVADEYFIVYDLATGGVMLRGSGSTGTTAAQQPPAGMLALALPVDVWSGDLAGALPEVRLALWQQVKTQRDGVIDGGAPTAIGVVDSDELSRSNISGAALGALIAQSASTPFSIEWTAKDNSVHTLDAAGMIGLGLAVLQHVSAAHDRARDLRAEIEAATDVPTLLQIDITAGWPE